MGRRSHHSRPKRNLRCRRTGGDSAVHCASPGAHLLSAAWRALFTRLVPSTRLRPTPPCAPRRSRSHPSTWPRYLAIPSIKTNASMTVCALQGQPIGGTPSEIRPGTPGSKTNQPPPPAKAIKTGRRGCLGQRFPSLRLRAPIASVSRVASRTELDPPHGPARRRVDRFGLGRRRAPPVEVRGGSLGDADDHETGPALGMRTVEAFFVPWDCASSILKRPT